MTAWKLFKKFMISLTVKEKLKKRFRFFNSAPLQCTAFLPKKTTFWYIHRRKMGCIDEKLILLFATAERQGSTV